MFALISTSLLIFMYFIVFIISFLFFVIVGSDGLTAVSFSVLFTFVFSIIQFFISPFIMDFTLRFMYNLKWVNINELPQYLQDFITQEFQKRGTKLPKIGIIDDFTPEAFTYGNFPGNARIVFSKGLLEILNEDEIKSVVAHEIGHIFHWDFVFMTLASFIPFILYIIYRAAYRLASSGNNRRGGGQLLIVALIAYLTYIISEYIVLYLSRLREYYADKFSAITTMNPNSLATALVKVAYGVLDTKSSENETQNTNIRSTPFKVLGLMDNKQAKNLRLALLNSNINLSRANLKSNSLAIENTIEITSDTTLNKYDVIGKTLGWDLFNPWATLIELNSTHPLVAKRIKNLKQIAKEHNLPFYINIPTSLPSEKDDNSLDLFKGSLWDEFIIDLFFQYLPLAGLISGIFVGIIVSSLTQNGFNIISYPLLLAGLGGLIKWFYTYNPLKQFKEYKIIDLLQKTKVSIIRSIPSILNGQIMGRGIAGYILSEDVTLKDETGFIYVDYRIGFQVAEMVYGFFITNNLIGKKVQMKGYYRRHYAPFFEVIEIKTEDGKIYRSYFRFLWLAIILISILMGLLFSILGII